MKKLTSIILAVLMVLSIFTIVPITAGAVTSGDYEYKILKDGTAKITRYNGNDKEVTIPSEIDGYTVTHIGDYAFECCIKLAIITIPDGVTYVGKNVFRDCIHLTSVIISDSVTSIDAEAFYGCRSLTNITIPDGVTSIGDSAFDGCNLENVVIGNGVDSLNGFNFNYSDTLKSIKIGNSVKSIDSNKFKNCKNLVSVTIGNGVINIGSCAFENCTSLKSITIPDNVVSIGNYAFYYTAFYNDKTNWENDVLYIGNYLIKAEYHISGEYEIKPDTKVIANYAFSSCDKLTSITVPDSVTNIGKYAFSDCKSLTSVSIGNSVISIDDYAFKNCKNLTSVTIPDNVVSIGYSAFENCGSLTNVIIGNGVTSIGWHAFYECINLISITISNSITNIGIDAFKDTAYYNDEKNWKNAVLYIDSCLIEAKDNISGNYEIKSETKVIAHSAFSNCDNLTSITIPKSVTGIGNGTFLYCKNLKKITVDKNNTEYSSLDDVLFNKNRTELIQYPIGNTRTTYKIPNSVTSIDNNAFDGCTNLTSITIPEGVTSIGDYAFRDCTSLKSVTIPNSVTSIGDDAFSFCKSLKSLIIGNSVTNIGKYAFYFCTNLTIITIPNSVTSIGDKAFHRCTSLKSVTIGNSVTSIGDEAFSFCRSLKSVKIPDSVTKIGDKAFGFTYSEDLDCSKIQYFKIIGYSDTEAERYANDNEFEFIDIADCQHDDKTVVNKKSATYFAKGYTGDKVCNDCYEVIKLGKATAKKALKAPTGLKAVAGKKQVTVSYKKVSGAKNYKITCKVGKTATIVTTSKLKYKIKGLKSKKTYTITVKAYVKSGKKIAYSAPTKAKKVKVK